MKKILSVILGSLLTLGLIAQTSGTVTINVAGNRNKQITLDGTNYTTTANTTTNGRGSIVIPNVVAGQHTLEVISDNQNGNRDNNVSTVFKLRQGYDMQITVRNNGTVQLKEVKSANTAVNGHPAQYKTPMSSSAFNTLLQNVRRQSRANTKLSLVTNAIADVNNYFTTSQSELLISQISSQTSRSTLLRNLYVKTTDPENYTDLINYSLNAQAARNEIIAYVNSYKFGNSNTAHNQGRYAMSDAAFDNILRSARNQWSSSAKLNYLSTVFADVNNFYTTSQAQQLITLVPDENNRLILAKSSYRGITDAGNFSQINNLLANASSRNDLNAYVNSYSGGVAYQGRQAMSDTNFEALYVDVQKKWGAGAKLSALNNIFSNTAYNFTTSQAKQLIELSTSENSRLQLAKASYRSIVDPANFTQIYGILSSTQSKNELAAYVKAFDPSASVQTSIVAMSPESFNTLYRSVQTTYGFGAKHNSLTEIFSNTSNYFTSDQARRLIELVSSENNRLTLAKLAWKQVVDPENYSLITAILSSQASKDEFEVYAKQ